MRLVWTKWRKSPIVVAGTVLVATLVASIAPGAQMLSAGAETPLEAARAAVAAATDRVEELNIEIAAAQGRADAATAQFWEQQEAVYLLETAIEGLKTTVDELDERRSTLKDEVQRVAIDRYMEPVNFESIIDADALNAKMRADALASLVTGSSTDAIDEYRRVSEDRESSAADLQERLDTRDAAAEAAVAAGEELTAELATLDARRARLLDELDQLNDDLAELQEAEDERVAAAAEAARLEAERERAEAAAALAAEIVEAPPTPEPTVSPFTPTEATGDDAETTDSSADGEQAAADDPAATTTTDATADSSTESAGSSPGSATEADASVSPGAEDAAGDDDAQTLDALVGRSAGDDANQTGADTAAGTTAPSVTAAPAPTAVPTPTAVPVPPTPTPVPTVVPTPVPAPAANGAMLCPLNGPFSHIDDYGAPRPGGRYHQGNDLMAASGTPVIAVVSGQLEHKFGNVGGYTARIKADDGGWYYFAHLSAYENQGAGWVEAGTVIGYVGNTGDAIHTPPHLHFEMHPTGYGNPVNPYSAVVASC